MPRDINGTICDIVFSPEARTNRMNTGGLFEHYINACSYQIQRDLWAITGISQEDKSTELKLKTLKQTKPDIYAKAWERLINYYRLIAPLQAYLYDSGKLGEDDKLANIATCIKDFVYLHIPSDFCVDYMKTVGILDEYVKPAYAPVTFKDYNGKWITTKDPVRIGSMYVMLLEKTGDDWSAVASAREQHYGFLAQIGKSDKYSEPGRPQPIKGLGETEFRLIKAYCGAEAIAEMMDRSNSGASHREVAYSLISADKPSAVVENINRTTTPFGGAAGIQIFTHVLNIMGLDLKYIDESSQDYEKMYLKEQAFYGKTLGKR